jgi:hypothetical protein
MVANSLLTTDLLLSEALMHLDNELVLAQKCNRDYEQEFGGPMKPGDTIRIRRPVRGTVRTGATRVVQDVVEGRTTMTVATQIGADLDFSSVDMTLTVDKFSERYIRPQMIKLANEIDAALHTELVNNTWNWVGTPGQTINSFNDFAAGPLRLDLGSVPTTDRIAILSPTDHWALLGSQTGLYISDVAKTALQRAKLGTYAGVEVFQSQNVKTHTNGTWSGSSPIAEIDNGTLSTTYASAKDSWTMTIHIDGLTSTTGTVLLGDVFTIENVYAVNVITGETLPHLQQFVVRESVTADGTGDADVVISPPIITSGPYKTCNAAAVDGANIVVIGSVNTGYAQNIVMHKDAITLAVPPMFKPTGAGVSSVSVKTYKGISMRLIEGYDFNNDLAGWRFDLLYGVKATEPNLATRISGAS